MVNVIMMIEKENLIMIIKDDKNYRIDEYDCTDDEKQTQDDKDNSEGYYYSNFNGKAYYSDKHDDKNDFWTDFVFSIFFWMYT